MLGGVASVLAAAGCQLLAGVPDLTPGDGDAGDDSNAAPDNGSIDRSVEASDAMRSDASDGPSKACDGGLSDCTGACVDLTSDDQNCGECGHDCMGTKCQGGFCAAVMLASPQNPWPTGIAVDMVNVYWANGFNGADGGSVMKCPKTGCVGSPVPLATNLNGPKGVATDGTNVYWTDVGDGKVMACPVANCSSPTVLAMNQNNPGWIAVDSTSVYWTNYGDGGPNGSVMSCPIACNNNPTPLATGQSGPDRIAVDATSVYWTDYVSSQVMSCSTKGCNDMPTELAFMQYNPVGVSVYGGTVYWTQSLGFQVEACKVTGCSETPSPLVPGLLSTNPLACAADSNYVYWLNGGGYQLMKCSTSGCAKPTIISDYYNNVGDITLDVTSVFWTARQGVFKVAK